MQKWREKGNKSMCVYKVYCVCVCTGDLYLFLSQHSYSYVKSVKKITKPQSTKNHEKEHEKKTVWSRSYLHRGTRATFLATNKCKKSKKNLWRWNVGGFFSRLFFLLSQRGLPRGLKIFKNRHTKAHQNRLWPRVKALGRPLPRLWLGLCSGCRKSQ